MKRNRKGIAFFIVVIIALIAVKDIWVSCSINGIGSFETEKKEIIRRANYLTSKVATTPQKLLDEMPSGIGEQFQGEWALYTCSMTCAALANIAIFNLSPSGTAFAIGCATSMDDTEFRNKLLKTAEIAGSTIRWFDKSHYLLANIALVGEAIALAMRTSAPQTLLKKLKYAGKPSE